MALGVGLAAMLVRACNKRAAHSLEPSARGSQELSRHRHGWPLRWVLAAVTSVCLLVTLVVHFAMPDLRTVIPFAYDCGQVAARPLLHGDPSHWLRAPLAPAAQGQLPSACFWR